MFSGDQDDHEQDREKDPETQPYDETIKCEHRSPKVCETFAVKILPFNGCQAMIQLTRRGAWSQLIDAGTQYLI